MKMVISSFVSSTLIVMSFLISASLISIVAQRLIRKLCPKCTEPYKVQDAMLSKLRLEQKEVTFYKPKGCSLCMNTGYAGRIG
ncbi:MAG: type II secretion system protein GspE, partial [Candidatus Margulisbacteria bacterium]|nr:type II secretion system protein GspE [Candidatus Margulisiibacteriota bacterium]